MPLPLAAMGIGAGLGALSHIFGGGGGPQTSTQSIDEASRDYILQRRAMALNMVGQGMPSLDPALLAAIQGYGGYADAGRMGLAAFTDPSVMAKFQAYGNEAMNPIFDYQRRQLESESAKRMAGARAFGVRGQMMGPDYSSIDRNQLQFGLENMRNAQQMAQMFANYGQFGIAGQHNLGQYFTERPMNWNQQAMGLLANAYGGPISTTTTSDNPNDRGNLFQSMLGGAMTGASFAMPSAPAAVAPMVSRLHSQGYGWGGYQEPQFGQFGQFQR